MGEGKGLVFSFISKVVVRKLFGEFDYTLPNDGSFSDVVIFYGDNGSGKTTLLKLIYHLLSMDFGIHHQEAIAKIPFEIIKLVLSDGSELSAYRANGIEDTTITFRLHSAKVNTAYDHAVFTGGNLRFQSKSGLDLLAYTTWLSPGLMGGAPSTVPVPKREMIEALKELEISVDFISTDRQVLTNTEVPKKKNAKEKSTWEELVSDEELSITELRQAYLTEAMRKAEAWIRAKAVEANIVGSDDANEIYSRVVRELTKTPTTESPASSLSKGKRVALVKQLSNLSSQFNRMGFSAPLRVDEIVAGLERASPRQVGLLDRVLDPYIDSIFARLKALEPIYESTSNFVNLINRFLSFKSLSFHLARGFSITSNKGATLRPTDLSSGEQQLLLIFCHIAVGGPKPRLLIIDEPEISLNVKWQRELIDALLQVARGSKVQFLFASHSIDFISSHRSRVAPLRAEVES